MSCDNGFFIVSDRFPTGFCCRRRLRHHGAIFVPTPFRCRRPRAIYIISMAPSLLFFTLTAPPPTPPLTLVTLSLPLETFPPRNTGFREMSHFVLMRVAATAALVHVPFTVAVDVLPSYFHFDVDGSFIKTYCRPSVVVFYHVQTLCTRARVYMDLLKKRFSSRVLFIFCLTRVFFMIPE